MQKEFEKRITALLLSFFIGLDLVRSSKIHLLLRTEYLEVDSGTEGSPD